MEVYARRTTPYFHWACAVVSHIALEWTLILYHTANVETFKKDS